MKYFVCGLIVVFWAFYAISLYKKCGIEAIELLRKRLIILILIILLCKINFTLDDSGVTPPLWSQIIIVAVFIVIYAIWNRNGYENSVNELLQNNGFASLANGYFMSQALMIIVMGFGACGCFIKIISYVIIGIMKKLSDRNCNSEA